MKKIPTLKELYNNVVADLESEMNVHIPLYGKVALRAIAAVHAAKLKLVYLQVGRLQKNIFVDTADPESMGGTLERFGRIKLGRNPFPARAGEYTVTVTGFDKHTIPAGTTFKSNDNSQSPGKLFILDSSHSLSGTSGSVTLRALEAGLSSRLAIGDKLSATVPIAGIDKSVIVTSESMAPIPPEDIEEYRQKIIEAFHVEPNGGSSTDYRLWAKDVQGVKQVYPYAASGFGGQINLFVEASVDASIDNKGTPSAEMLSAVESVINFDPDETKDRLRRGRKPLHVQVNYLPVTIKEVNIIIQFFSEVTPKEKELIENVLKAIISQIRPFVGAIDNLKDQNDTLQKNILVAAILQALPGSRFGAIDIEVSGNMVDQYEFLYGEIPHLNRVDITS